MTKPLTDSQFDALAVLALFARNRGLEEGRTGQGLKAQALIGLEKRGLVKQHFLALTQSTYWHITEAGLAAYDVACQDREQQNLYTQPKSN